MILKPKSLRVHVPNHGVIDRADFTEEHLKACVKQVKKAGLDVDEYIRKRFDIVSYGDLPLFVDTDSEKEATAKAEAEAERVKAEETAEAERVRLEAEQKEKDDNAELARLLAEEEAAKAAGTATQSLTPGE